MPCNSFGPGPGFGRSEVGRYRGLTTCKWITGGRGKPLPYDTREGTASKEHWSISSRRQESPSEGEEEPAAAGAEPQTGIRRAVEPKASRSPVRLRRRSRAAA